MQYIKRIGKSMAERTVSVLCMIAVLFCSLFADGFGKDRIVFAKESSDETVTLRVCNWEEYIDLGDWDEEERIVLADGSSIIGENSIVEDFESWYYETYGIRVKVEYSCFGTNEDLYNQLTLGDVYDLVCPSDYMIMKLMAEKELCPFSEEFFDGTKEHNYYVRGVSDFIRQTFDENEINGESWSRYAAGYMWGVTGVLYNPAGMTEEEAGTWSVFNNPKFLRQVTIKDNVRDSYFAALGAIQSGLLMDASFRESEAYRENLARVMNDVSDETVEQVGDLLQDIQNNVYSFETDSGKADMISGKVLANYQWSGDAVYAMDQAEKDGFYLNFAVPRECTNLWFDGWIMLKKGIAGDAKKQHAAEAFVNYMSRPDNAVRNMYYIGYTSVISGGEDDTVYQYVEAAYGAGEEEDDTILYPLGFFFAGDSEDKDYMLITYTDQAKRQLYAQYPPEDVLARSAIMEYFDEDASRAVNRMWIDVRCYNINDVPAGVWVLVALIILVIILLVVRSRKGRMR